MVIPLAYIICPELVVVMAGNPKGSYGWSVCMGQHGHSTACMHTEQSVPQVLAGLLEQLDRRPPLDAQKGTANPPRTNIGAMSAILRPSFKV
jgi:hypothetical protein